MKTLRYLLFAVVGSLLMASCGYPDHLKTLPKETVAVVSFDLAGMASKGDLDKLQEAEFYKKMQEKMGEKDAESAKETDEFLKNPLNYGINFLEPVYLFVINNGAEKAPHVGFSIALGDSEKFKTFITKVAKVGEDGVAIESATGYSLLKTTDAEFAWNEAALIVIPRIDKENDASATFTSIFTEKDKDQSVVSSPGFKAYYKNSKDISGWFSMGVLGTIMEAAQKLSSGAVKDDDLAEYEKQMEQYKEASFQFHISFNDDEIYTEYITDLPDAMKEMYKDEVLRPKSPEKISSLIKSTDLSVMALSLDIPKYLEMMAKNPVFAGDNQEEMANYITMAQQFVAPFDGDLLISIIDVKQIERTVTESIPVVDPADVVATDSLLASDTTVIKEEPETWDYAYDFDVEYKDTTYVKKETIPVFLAATTVNDESFGMLGMFIGKNKPKSGKVNTIDLGDYKVYGTIKDKVVILSNDKKTVEAINDGTFKGDANCTMAQGASNHGAYFYVNADYSEYPKLVQELITSSTKSSKEKAALLKFVAMFDYFEMYTKEDFTTAVVSLKLKTNGHNSLYTIIEHTGNAAYEMGAFN